MQEYNLDAVIRKVPDFPKKGILYYDITSILMEPAALRFCVEKLTSRAKESGAAVIAAIEARGFLFASPVAERLCLPLVLVRKKGKLPGKTLSRSFALEYGEASIEIHASDIQKNLPVFLIDDLVATGGTLRAAADIFRESGSPVCGAGGVVGLPFLGYEKALAGIPVYTLINYQGET
ncbi:MAG: adenine phosphoribosyltransferase [Spirochaetales bacterium]|jgi:adenine phosphoribosyltransferase|nr:adenine phosphoribosyltransferase [Spirochaetales bacterium]